MQLDLSALQTSADDLDPSFRWGTHVSPRLDPNGSAKAMVPNKELISQITEENWENYLVPSDAGKELYLNSVPEDCSETEMNDFFQTFEGFISFRMMRHRDVAPGFASRFAFVSFNDKLNAQNALIRLRHEMFKGTLLFCTLSVMKNKLYVGNLPHRWTQAQIGAAFVRLSPFALSRMDFLTQPDNPDLNRGYIFLEFRDHQSAADVLKLIQSRTIEFGSRFPVARWAQSVAGSKKAPGPRGVPVASAGHSPVGLSLLEMPDSGAGGGMTLGPHSFVPMADNCFNTFPTPSPRSYNSCPGGNSYNSYYGADYRTLEQLTHH